jgi:hypothetical protein
MKANWYWEAIAEEEGDLLPYGDKIRAALTPDEYQTLLAWIREAAKKKRPQGRPPVDVIRVAVDCLMYECFLPKKVAVANTAEGHGISRTSVYNARRKFLSK